MFEHRAAGGTFSSNLKFRVAARKFVIEVATNWDTFLWPINIITLALWLYYYAQSLSCPNAVHTLT